MSRRFLFALLIAVGAFVGQVTASSQLGSQTGFPESHSPRLLLSNWTVSVLPIRERYLDAIAVLDALNVKPPPHVQVGAHSVNQSSLY